MKSRMPAAPASAPELAWIHDGARWRVTAWPDATFLVESSPGRWAPAVPGEAALASAALGVSPARWRRYLEFVPAEVAAFLGRFAFSRMAALFAVTRCPELAAELTRTPALVAFLVAHRGLRGGENEAWGEIAAVFERDGIFGLLQWLGLPASRQTLEVLRRVGDPDLPRRLLEPLRTALWEPEVLWSLGRGGIVSDEQLARACHALAA
ncbi:MAG: hypothetical protein ACKOTF_08465 [Opitutaceae bacterium]